MRLSIKILTLLLSITFLTISQNWETIGGNSARTSYAAVSGPSQPDILWEGSLNSLFGSPIFIYNNKLITRRIVTWEYTPIVCYDLYTGDTLWTITFHRDGEELAVPLGIQNNVLYASNWDGTLDGDSLYAIDLENGSIIWRCDSLILGNYHQGVAFTENDDLIIALPRKIARIDRKTGKVLWATNHNVPVIDDYCGLAVFEDNVYGWEGNVNTGLNLIEIEIENGTVKCKKPIPSATNSGLMTATLPVISLDGIIYALKADDNLVALKKDEDSLKILWNIPIDSGGSTKPAVGPDQKVYFTNHKKIMSADPLTGVIIDSSIMIKPNAPTFLDGYLAIDCIGTVYFNNHGTYEEGKIYSFTKDLELNWVDSINHIAHAGPALGPNGILAVAGRFNILKVYRTDVNIISEEDIIGLPQVSHVCTPMYISFKYYVQNQTNVRLLLYNTRGQEVYSHYDMPGTPGFQCVNIRDIHENCGSGRFIYKLDVGGKSATNTLSIVE